MRRVERGAPRRPRRISRIVGIVSIGIANAFLVPFGCGVDRDHAPGLPNQTPNPFPLTTTTGAGSSAASGGSGGPGNVCECAAGIYARGDANCGDCVNALVPPGKACGDESLACAMDPGCKGIIACLQACAKQDGGDATSCVTGCILPLDEDDAHEKYAALLGCLCDACATCTSATPLDCPAGTGGADAGEIDAADATDEGG